MSFTDGISKKNKLYIGAKYQDTITIAIKKYLTKKKRKNNYIHK